MTSQVVPMPNPREGSQLAARTSRADPALPSILGMYAFAAATFIVAAHMAHWLGNAQSAIVVFPLVLFVGGLAQFYASTWAFRTGDGIALAMHGIWGSFWTAYGLLELLYATGYAVVRKPASPNWASGS